MEIIKMISWKFPMKQEERLDKSIRKDYNTLLSDILLNQSAIISETFKI
jgi:hypothetical protein